MGQCVPLELTLPVVMAHLDLTDKDNNGSKILSQRDFAAAITSVLTIVLQKSTYFA